ncbi:fatty acid desaturase [Amylibacter sp. SFDW26]|uniref:fatty acid desaturase n=1 Tax=Amylibacter sp. SFDW26 TaxID=2652722 RepID=UPI0012629655|nr:fatty acid desaturase [Amylibacter sp. SFDW26]KAB7613504.1 fatty acid desaturase [Amylibacter sp. SFDW26]
MDFDDNSTSFNKVKSEIKNSQGVSYSDFLRTLTPNFRVAQRDLLLGHMALVTTLLVLCFLPLSSWPISILAILAGSFLIGYWFAYIQLFIHEAAHYNMAAKKENNEFIGNFAIGILVGSSIKDYRKIHFQHHRALGTTEDSENSYFFPFNIIMIFKMLLGIRVVEVIMNRKKIVDQVKPNDGGKPRISGILIAGLILHCSILGLLFITQEWIALFSWGIGIAIVFPFFGAVRQILEHRSLDANPQIDYSEVDHGAMTRIFGDDIFSRTFGAAGFNKHLIHHWEPRLSYTVYDNVLAYISDTQLAETIDKRSSSYGRVFVDLLKSS